ncbi:MAG: gliding motility protein GldL [Bacteroidales bacterium]|nr:gliding motility protein GldL [Bacteroidales bacterium]
MARKINIIIRLQHWMDSVPGQTFLNYAYSWGASIVILGALFKLTHLPGGNIMLFIGMGTEVVVFFLSAFDRPFDKSEIGKELPHDYETDEEIEARLRLEDGEDFPENEEELPENENAPMPHIAAVGGGGAVIGGGEPFVGGNAGGAGGSVIIMGGAPAPQSGEAAATEAPAATVAPDPVEAARQAIALNTPEGAEPFENEAQRLAAIIRAANDELLRRAQAALSPEMEAATQEYIEKLRTLADTFQKVDQQSAKLTRDSEEMENLNRTLTAINKTYDLHFKSISQQVGTIEQINEQTRRLALQIEELNGVYGRMIQALTVNMNRQAPQQGFQTPQQGFQAPQQF